MMLKRIFLALFLTFLSQAVWAQKFGYIDSELILNQMPEYKEAQKQLNQFSLKWQKEIEDLQVQLDKIKQDYEAEEVLLTEDMKKERQDTITAREKIIRDKQRNYFGYNGMLYLKRQELIKPVQDKVFAAVEKVAKEKKLAIVFDKSSALVMVYTDPIHDYTDFVLEALGFGDKNDTVPTNKKTQ
ncbi:MAG: OmpH family outer membrane protein [Cytophagaceae bacterium]